MLNNIIIFNFICFAFGVLNLFSAKDITNCEKPIAYWQSVTSMLILQFTLSIKREYFRHYPCYNFIINGIYLYGFGGFWTILGIYWYI